MARLASTNDLSEEVYEKLESSNCKAELKLERWTGTAWVRLEDLDENAGVDWKKSAKTFKYANFSLLPQASTIDFTLISENGKYSEGSGAAEDGIIDIDTKIKLWAGYKLSAKDAVTNALDLSAGTYWHTQYSSGIKPLSTSSASTMFSDLDGSLLDSFLYNSAVYSCTGYYYKNIDLEGVGYYSIGTISVTANTTAGRIYWRFVGNVNGAKISTSWNNGGALENGTKVITVNADCLRYLQIAIVFDGTSWSGGETVSAISYTSQQKIEWMYRDVFYLDTPEFDDPKAPEIPSVKCSGRDAFKFALETSLNIGDVNGLYVHDVIEFICDKCGIKYSATSIADLTTFGARTLAVGFEDEKKAFEILELCMQIINKSGATKYQMFMEYDATEDENILFVQPRPSTYDAAWVFNYAHYESVGGRRKNRDKLLQRLLFTNKSGTTSEEVQLDQEVIVADGNYTLSWIGDAEKKRIEQSGAGSATVTLITGRVSPTQIELNVAGLSGSITLTAFGSKWSSAPDYEGEDFNIANMLATTGTTTETINKMIVSDAEAKAIAQGFIESFGTPIYEANNIRWAYLNLIPEINDSVMLWARFLFQSDLYFVTGISYHWDRSSSPSESTQFNIDDTGRNFTDEGAIIYDRNEAPVSGTLILYNEGFVYDMAVSPAGSDADVLDSLFDSNTGEA